MLMKITNWIAMAALLALAALWGSAANSQFSRFLLACVACLGATAILLAGTSEEVRVGGRICWPGSQHQMTSIRKLAVSLSRAVVASPLLGADLATA